MRTIQNNLKLKTLFAAALLLFGMAQASAQVEYVLGVYDKDNNVCYYLATNDNYTGIVTRSTYDAEHCLWTANAKIEGSTKRNVYQVHNGNRYYLTTTGTAFGISSTASTVWSANTNGKMCYVNGSNTYFPYLDNRTFKIGNGTGNSKTRILPISEDMMTSQNVWSRAGEQLDPNDPNSRFSNVLEGFFCEAGNSQSDVQSFTVFNTIPSYLLTVMVPNGAPFQVSKDGTNWYQYIGLVGDAENTVYVRMVGQDDNGVPYDEGNYEIPLNMPLWPGVTLSDVTLKGSIGATLSATPNYLTGFDYPYGSINYVRPAQELHIEGTSLANDVIVETPLNYEVCRTLNGTYQDSIHITPEGNVVNTTVYVKLKGGLEIGEYFGRISVSYAEGEGADRIVLRKSITVLGSVNTTVFQATPAELAGLHGEAVKRTTIAAYGVGTAVVATVPAESAFEISKTADGPWASSLTITDADEDIHENVFVRFKSDAEGRYYEDFLTFTAGAHSLNVPLSGTMVYPASGIVENRVIVNELEDHTWTYYAGVPDSVDGGHYNSSYLGQLYSPEPRDVEIIYRGGGVDNASPVAISGLPDENQNTMVYLLTLERDQATGKYPYTVIPNPFSKRPRTLGLNNSSQKTQGYYGFGGWRIVSGGEYIRGKNNGDVLALDEELTLENLQHQEHHTLAGIIEFEATWVPARVWIQASCPFPTTGTYETNFWVINANKNGLGNLQWPMTITMMTPDGGATGDYRNYALSGVITVKTGTTNNAVSKIEWLTMNVKDTIDAGGRNLFIGRGVTNRFANGCTIFGSNSNTEVKQKLRIESGLYDKFRHYVYKEYSTGRLVYQHVVFGSDYDKAKGDNSKLTFRGNMYVGDGYKTDGYITLNTVSGHEICRTCVKSGQFGANLNVGRGNADESYYYGITGLHQKGYRYLEIQGGVFANVCGGIDKDNTPDMDAFRLRIKGGTIRGSVFGAAQYAASAGTRNIIITGGTIKGWVAGGANGTQDDGGVLTGAAYVYVGGNAQVNSNPDGIATTTIINRAVGGNVFGAGCGFSQNSTSGQVTLGTNVVIADNAFVERGVYGGGGFGRSMANAYIYVTGGRVNAFNGAAMNGTDYNGSIKGGLFGGSSMNNGTNTYIYMTDGQVRGGIYGGSNYAGRLTGSSNIKIIGGEVGSVYAEGNVFGGGYGESTSVAGNTNIEVYDNAKIHGNIYGGSKAGSVAGNTNIVFGNSSLRVPNPAVEANNIFGAGYGSTSNVAGFTTVTVRGGHVLNNVYGGGENGTVNKQSNAFATNKQLSITIDGNTLIDGNVFGGGSMGASYASTLIDIYNGSIKGSVYAGAEGRENTTIFVSGLRTLNMMGGEVYGSLYGGSCNASDGDRIVLAGQSMPAQPTASSNPYSKYISFVNMSGGRVRSNVYGAGFFGELFGSSDVNVGKVAIMSANSANINRKSDVRPDQICHIYGSIYGGANWGDFSEGTGFNSTTTKGHAHVYVDGTGYDQTADEYGNPTGSHYLDIGESIYGAGTSCYAGMMSNNVNVRNFGLPIRSTSSAFNNNVPYNEIVNTTRSLRCIQQCDTLIIDNSNINFSGEGDMTVPDATILYCLYGIRDVAYVGNNSSVIFNQRTENIKSLRSVKVEDFYSPTVPTFTTINLTAVNDTSTFQLGIENTIRINEGHSLKVRYTNEEDEAVYGELAGFFRISIDSLFNSFIVARPKLPNGNAINEADGGFLCYHNAMEQGHNFFTDNGTPDTRIKQYPYLNSVNAENKGFRTWRFSATDNYSTVTMPLSIVTPVRLDEEFSQVQATLNLPPYTGNSPQTRIEIIGADYGQQVVLVDAALFNPSTPGEQFIYYDPNTMKHIVVGDSTGNGYIRSEFNYMATHPNSAFGLTIQPTGNASIDSLYVVSQHTLNDSHLIDYTAQNNAAEVPILNFLLTYSNLISTNTSLSPVTFIIHRYDSVMIDGVLQEVMVDEILVPVTITTLTALGQDIELNTYALYGEIGYGNADEHFNVKAVMPYFNKPLGATGYYFGITGMTFETENYGDMTGVSKDTLSNDPMPDNDFTYAMLCKQALNQDQQNGWMEAATLFHEERDAVTISDRTPYLVGQSDGRKICSIDFTLVYNSFLAGQGTEKMRDGKVGTFVFDMVYTTDSTLRYVEGPGGTFKIRVNVIKKSVAHKYYLDGIYGDDRAYTGQFPDRAKRTLQGIYDIGYTTQDTIIVVNPVTVGRNSNLAWSNENFSGHLVTLYRYSGNHRLSVNPGEAGYPDSRYALRQNDSAIVVVKSGNMTITGIVLDGLSELDGVVERNLNPEGLAISPRIPLVVVQQSEIPTGGTLTLEGSTEIRNNNNKGVTTASNSIPGGGVYVDPISTLTIGGDAKIYDNQVQASRQSNQNGAGVYMDGGTASLRVNGLATINNNVKHYVDGSNITDFANNVYMREAGNYVFVNAIMNDIVDPATSIGITKMLNANGTSLEYSPAVICNDPAHLLEIFTRNTNFFDDLDINIQHQSSEAPYNTNTIYFKRR